jgi:hypothetical protein
MISHFGVAGEILIFVTVEASKRSLYRLFWRAVALLREYRSLASTGLLASDLGAIGHSQTRHTIQDGALE